MGMLEIKTIPRCFNNTYSISERLMLTGCSIILFIQMSVICFICRLFITRTPNGNQKSFELKRGSREDSSYGEVRIKESQLYFIMIKNNI